MQRLKGLCLGKIPGTFYLLHRIMMETTQLFVMRNACERKIF